MRSDYNRYWLGRMSSKEEEELALSQRRLMNQVKLLLMAFVVSMSILLTASVTMHDKKSDGVKQRRHAQEDELSVLFIGDASIRSIHVDIPAMVSRMAKHVGKFLNYSTLAHQGWSWKDHSLANETIQAIQSRVWNVVVLQETSIVLSFSNDFVCNTSQPFLEQLVHAIRTTSPYASIQFYLTWGRPYEFSDSYETIQDELTTRYLALACMNKPAKVAPVGEAFKVLRNSFDENLFNDLFLKETNDDNHLSLIGSYFSACVHFSTLFAIPCFGNTFIPDNMEVHAAILLQQVADYTMSLRNWNFPFDSKCTECICQCSSRNQ